MQLLDDRYEPQQSLGKKAGRQTWLARDLQTQELVVVKLLTFSHEFEWDDLKLFEREAATLRSLSHPAIPCYLDFFELDSDNHKGFALVQTYIEARSLEQHLKSGRTFSEVEVNQLAKDLLGILGYLHDRQPPVIHRDIKPSNVLLTDRSGNSPGQVYLVDFGSVQTLAARDGGTMTIVGTYGYMPPEQFGGRTSPASDLYSLGATLIYLITGQHPADLPQEDLRLQFEDLAQVSPSFISWLKWLTEPSLSKRPKTIGAALEGLERSPESNSGVDPLVIKTKPTYSKIALVRDAEALEITVSSRKLQSKHSVGSISPAVLSLVLVFLLPPSLLLLVFALGPMIVHSAFFFLMLSLVFGVPTTRIILSFARARLVINQQKVSLTHKLFKLHYARPFSTKRRYLWKLALSITGDRLSVLAGTQKINFFGTVEEMNWLAYELSDWLGLPIERE